MSVKHKLNRLKKHVIREEEEIVPEKPAQDSNTALWEDYQTSVFTYDNQYCLIREVVYPLDYKHGHYRLREFKEVVARWNESELQHPLSSKNHHPGELFFFDTETTGLGGGTGNTIFLLGQAQVLDNCVVVKQHLLPKPGNEVALYQSFLKGINSKTLVTYNGKAFDWPQVKTRHTLIREQVPSLPPFGHFDLFHAARRLWKNELESVKLSKVESEILGIQRENDIPGFLAPMIYFEFVKQQNPEIIAGVLKHNEIDVLSLITLYTHLSTKLLDINSKTTNSEHYEIARWLEYIGEKDSALRAYSSFVKKESSQEQQAKFALSLLYKKQKNWKQAVMLWEEIVSEQNKKEVSFKAAVELAKFYEHQEKDFLKAMEYTDILRQRSEKYFELNKLINAEEISKRKERIERKYYRYIARASAKNE
ncbi:ribonuclease H-like domain-containing protein [Metabacillus halosaccharovorans]|uniref:Ribonuclease H-like domain-containing protein n=1 Tax=Metabacillus halosaccharovorans TaxID=930124 RepID=A0ABT3DP71_9BACI|nr:ribonuclease H-like domain-containing protein [Metabacillus halosaccharovorans]MCV9888402.1 ribonuclease H-like domain-containing protein [Metabacillus halosaccharovorans]